MSLDRSLKVGSKLAAKRSVLKRSERIAKMTADKKYDPTKNSALNLPKTLVGKAVKA